MVAEVIPFVFPRTGQMHVTQAEGGILNVGFQFPNGHGAIVGRGFGEKLFRLVAIDERACLAYLPEVLGEGAERVEHLTSDEVCVLLARIAALPSRLQ